MTLYKTAADLRVVEGLDCERLGKSFLGGAASFLMACVQTVWLIIIKLFICVDSISTQCLFT
jgi:hypothetical protein